MKTPVNKFLVILVAVLFISNIALAWLLWNKKTGTDKPGNGKKGDWIAKELGLDDKQKQDHKKMREVHFGRIKPLMDSITAARSSLYSLLDDSTTNDSLFNQFVGIIGKKQSLVSSYAFEHFRELRAICNKDQKVKLDTIIQRIVRDMGKRGIKPSPPSDN